MTIQERAQELIQEKQQAIARINQIDGALMEFETIIKEAQTSETQEEVTEEDG